MTQPVDAQRELRQLDNDVQSIYELLGTISMTQVRHGNRLGDIETKLLDVDAKLGHVDVQLGHVDVRLGHMDAKLDTIIQLFGNQSTD